MCLDRVHDVEKVTQGTGEAVILGDGDHVALAQLVEQAVKALATDAGPIIAAARSLVESRFSFRDHSLPAYLSLMQELFA